MASNLSSTIVLNYYFDELWPFNENIRGILFGSRGANSLTLTCIFFLNYPE